MKIDLGLIIEEKAWKQEDYVSKKNIANLIKQTLGNISAFQNVKTVEIALLLTDNEKMRKLNHEFRAQNKPTNVLSFPDVEIKSKDLLEFLHMKDYIYVGDIAMGYDKVKAEAGDGNIEMSDHFVHLLVHGVLHLVGYDHMEESEAKEMMDLEVQILKKFGILSPY